jgi:DNA (cytosine-5)-methyltransferase 1
MEYHKKSPIYSKIKNPINWITEEGVLAEAFETDLTKNEKENSFEIEGKLWDVSDNFNKNSKMSPFENSGIIINRKVHTQKVHPKYNGKKTTLGDILLPETEVSKEFFINGDLEKWMYLKGSKKEKRYNRSQNFHYTYTEGSMIFPDSLNSPSRTIVTGEGGSTASRFKHVVKTESGKLRRLTPVELERLNMFPDNHTEGCSDIKRAFLMGNALVTGVIERIGKSLITKVK